MKKILLIPLFFLSCSAFVHAQYENIRFPLSSDDKEMIKRYNLRSMKLYFTGAADQDSLTHEIKYDKSGKLIYTLSDGVYYYYEYDKNGNTTRLTDSFRDKETRQLTRDTFIFDYDASGFLSHARFNDDESTFIYDPKSLTLIERRKNANWPEPLTNSYTYNNNRDLIEMHFQDPGAGTVTTEFIMYNNNRKITKDVVSILSKDGDIDSITTLDTYNDKSKIIEEITRSSTLSADGNLKTKKMDRKDFYDDKNRLIEEFLYEDGIEKERYIFTYNQNSYEPLSETFYNKTIQQRTDQFELDPRGLPVTLTETENGVTVKFKYKFDEW